MNKFLFFSVLCLLVSCSSRQQMTYINDASKSNNWSLDNFEDSNYKLNSGDILKINVSSIIPEAAAPYNKTNNSVNSSPTIELIRLEGYLVNDSLDIVFPVLGLINVKNLSAFELSQKITHLLKNGNHLTSPIVKVSVVNRKFTILGEVNKPGTFDFFDKKINIFQALGHAEGISINAKKNHVILIRVEHGLKNVYDINLTDKDLLNSSYYYIRNNDILIINPSFARAKSAGFIGSPSSISSIASLLLSITLLIINN